MGILHLSLVSLSLFLQEPEAPRGAAPQSPPAAAVDLDAWLSEDAVATVVVRPSAESIATLSAGPMARLWHDDSFAEVRELASQGLEQLGQSLGLPTATLLELAGNGFAIGIGESENNDQPDLLIALVLGSTESTVRAASTRWSTGGGLHTAAGTPLMRLKGTPLFCGFVRGCFVVSTGITPIDAAEQRLAAAAAATPRGDAAPPLARFRLALDRLRQIGERRLPPPIAPRVAAVVGALGLADSKTFELSLTGDESGLTVQASCDLAPGHGLVPTLVGKPDALLPVLAQAVPAGAQAFGAGGVDLGAVLTAVLECAQAVEPAAEQAIGAFLASAEQRGKVAVRKDLLGAFAPGLVSALWREGDETVFGIGARLQDAMRFQAALNGLLRMLPVRPERVDCGVPALVFPPLPGSENRAAVAIVDDWLVVGSAPAAVAGFCRQVRSKEANPLVAEQLEQVPAGTSWLVWQSPDGLRSSALAGGLDLPEAVLEGLPPSVAHVVVGDGTVAWQCDASMAGVQFLLPARQAAHQFAGMKSIGAARRTPGQKPDPARARTGARPKPQGTVPPVAGAGRKAGGKPGRQGGKAGGSAADTGGGPQTVDDPLATEAEVAVLTAAADNPTGADLAALASLLSSASPAVAARATWCLGQNRSKAALQILGSAALAHQDAEVRRQALAALIAQPDATIEAAAIAALGDPERSVRTLAAQLVGRSRSKDSADALVGMVREQSETGAKEPLTDVAAAVLAAHDLGDPLILVPMATAAPTADPLVGQALAFLFQGLSPKLSKADEAEVMVAVLDHEAPLLRRYAIQRLGELGNPAAGKVLESRLASESKELQPLVRVALDRVRGQDLKLADDDLATRIQTNAMALVRIAEAHKLEVAGGFLAFVLLITWITALRVRAARRRRAEAAVALAAPTEGFEEQQYDAPAEEQEPVATGGRWR